MFSRLRRRQTDEYGRPEPVVFDDPEDVQAIRQAGQALDRRNIMGRLRGARGGRASEELQHEQLGRASAESPRFVEEQQPRQSGGFRRFMRLPTVSRAAVQEPDIEDDVIPATPIAGVPAGRPQVLRKSRRRFPLDDDVEYFAPGLSAEDAEAMRYEAGPSGVPHSERGSVVQQQSPRHSNREVRSQHSVAPSQRGSVREVRDAPGPPQMVEFPRTEGGGQELMHDPQYPPISEMEPRFRRISGGKLVKRRRGNTLEGPEVVPPEPAQPAPRFMLRQLIPAQQTAERELPPTTEPRRSQRRRLFSGGLGRRSRTVDEGVAPAPPPHEEAAMAPHQDTMPQHEQPIISHEIVASPVPSVAPSVRSTSRAERRMSDTGRTTSSAGRRSSRRASDVPFPQQQEERGSPYPTEMYHDTTVFREGSSIAPTMSRGDPSLQEQRSQQRHVLTRRSARRSIRGSEGGRSGSGRGSGGGGEGDGGHEGGGGHDGGDGGSHREPRIHSPDQTPGNEHGDPFGRNVQQEDEGGAADPPRRKGALRFFPSFGKTGEELEGPLEAGIEAGIQAAVDNMRGHGQAQGQGQGQGQGHGGSREADAPSRTRRPSILGRMMRRKSSEGPSVEENTARAAEPEMDRQSQQGTRGRRSGLLSTFIRRVENEEPEVIGSSPRRSETGSLQGSRGRKSSLLGMFSRRDRDGAEEEPAIESNYDEGSRTGTQRSRSSRRRRGNSLLSRFRRPMEEPEGSHHSEHGEQVHEENVGGEEPVHEAEGPHEIGGDHDVNVHVHLHMPEGVHAETEAEHQAHIVHEEAPPMHEAAVVADAPVEHEAEGVPVIARAVRDEGYGGGQPAPEPLFYQVPPLDPRSPVVDATTFGMQSPGTKVKKEALFDGALVLYIDEEAKVDVGKMTPDGQVVFDTPVPEGWKIDAIITFPAGLALNQA